MWYLVGLPSYKNLGETLEGVLARHFAAHRRGQAEESTPPSPETEHPRQPPKSSPKEAELSQAKREERLARYQHVEARLQQGFSQTAIADRVGIGHATGSRWLRGGIFAEQQPRPQKNRS